MMEEIYNKNLSSIESKSNCLQGLIELLEEQDRVIMHLQQALQQTQEQLVQLLRSYGLSGTMVLEKEVRQENIGMVASMIKLLADKNKQNQKIDLIYDEKINLY